MDDFLHFVGGPLAILLFALVGAFPVICIINYVFTPTTLVMVFGTATLGYWKAYWLFVFFGMFTLL